MKIQVSIALLLITACAVAAEKNEKIQPSSSESRLVHSTDPEVIVGDRLFFETRFAQFFYASVSGQDVNVALANAGDPVVRDVARQGQNPLPGPFRGQAISCRHCHLGDDFLSIDQFSQRTYCDFMPRTAIPFRGDRFSQTVRNTSQMVDLGLAREVPRLFHFDGEFASAEDLVVSTLVGRNMGWQLHERPLAIKHIARVIREDNGTVNVRHLRGQGDARLPYRLAMLGIDPALHGSMRVPAEYRVDVNLASDEEVVLSIAKFMHAYVDSLRFGSKTTPRQAESPYDVFLKKNNLPSEPEARESATDYGRRLLTMLNARRDFRWVDHQDGHFALHDQAYLFGRDELAGMKIFLTETHSRFSNSQGNCVACHPPPQFTDHRFHNTGISQLEYDALFGDGEFAQLHIPSLAERNQTPEAFLPMSVMHPNAIDRFRSAPSKSRPGFADLGMWNIFANPAFPRPQQALTTILCSRSASSCEPAQLLDQTVGLFKTPSIRNLGHSQPYFHSGRASTLEDAVSTYVAVSNLARAHSLRNAAPELSAIRLDQTSAASIASFLRALNEDYH